MLGIIFLLFVGLIAYIHWIQGLLSGFISAVLAIIAAAVALGYYEPLANAMSGGKFQDQAHAVTLIALFAITYIVLRVIFDKAVPGNIRVLSTADKIGGAVFGVVAGIFAVGIVAIAAQTLPLGPSVLGYSRYPLKSEDPSVTIDSEGGRRVDRTAYNTLINDDLEKGQQGMLIPLDDMVVAMISHLSDKGALSNGKPFKSIHPDLMQELFGQRLGIEITAKRTARNDSKNTQVTVEQINLIDKPLPRRGAEFDAIWKLAQAAPLTAPADKQLLSVRLVFSSDAADENNVVRFSTGSVRLVTREPDGAWKNNFPLGTLQDGKTLWVNRPDDYLFVNMQADAKGADVVFMVDKAGFFEDPTTLSKGEGRPAEGVFLEFKRMAKVPLQDAKLVLGLPEGDIKYNVARKKNLLTPPPGPVVYTEPAPTPPTPTPTETARTEPTPPTNTTPSTATPPVAATGDNGWDKAPLEKPQLIVTTKLPVPINVESADADGELATDAASGSWKGKKFVEVDVDASSANATPAKLQAGANPIAELMVPAGKQMVHVRLTPRAGQDSWAWAASLGDFAVFDGKEAHKPFGAWVEVTQAAGMIKIHAHYGADRPLPSLKKVEGAVKQVDLIYLLPSDTKPVELQYQGKAGGLKL
jgi:hypothetical protein